MSCPLCYEIVDNENKLVLCDICNLYRCSYCDQSDCCNSVCAICLVYKIQGDGNNEKQCQSCNKIVCIVCTALTGCQTIDGVCKRCFKYKCMVCGLAELDTSASYLYDMEQHYPTCNNCRSLY